MQAIANDEDPRSDPRSHLFLVAVLCAGTSSCPVRVRNLSAHGALLEGGAPPPAKTSVLLKRGSLKVTGTIAWARGRTCGIRFDHAIAVGEWVERAGPFAQQRIDSAIADFRDGRVPAVPVATELSGDRCESLDQVSDLLVAISENLAAQAAMSIELAEAVLKIDAAAHAIGTIARRSS